MSTAAIAFAVGVSFVVLLWATNGIVFWYVKGAVRQSLDEGVHAGIASGPGGNAVAACNDKVAEALDALLADAMKSGVAATCTDTGDGIQATATVNLSAFSGPLFGGTLTYNDTLTRRAPRELSPPDRPGI